MRHSRRALLPPRLWAAAALLALLAGVETVHSQSTPDADALLELKAAVAGSTNALNNWTATTNPCNPATPWVGVTCTAGRVTAV